MTKYTNNELLEALIELSIKYPNDTDLGKYVRAFLNKIEDVDNQQHTK